MFSKIKKYVIGFFVLAGGILFAFLSGKSAGRKDEKLGNLKDDIKKNKKSIKKTEKLQKNVKKSLASKKKALDDIKKQRESFGVFDNNSNTKDVNDFLKKYTKNKK
jgi:septal ring factor EnvC (AmiA/AmiB activator)